MKTAVFNRVEYSILMRTETGLKYGIQTRQNVSGYSPEEYPNIGIRQAGGWWYIDHIPTGLKVSTFGCKSRKAALESYIQDYHSKVNEVETKRQDFLKKAVETFQKSPLEEEAAAWETVNYCTVRNHRFDKVTEAARRAGLIIRNADKITYQDGGNVNISGPSEKLEAVKAIIAEYEKRDLARAAEEAAAKEAAERPETISKSDEGPRPFRGQVVSFTGKLSSMTRAEAIAAVKAAGGLAYKDMPAGTTLLVVGSNPGQKKQDLYDKWIGQVKKITEAQFMAMLEGV